MARRDPHGSVRKRDLRTEVLADLPSVTTVPRGTGAGLEADADAVSRAALDIVRALVLATTADGRIALFNKAAEEFTGYRESEVLGREIWNFLVPEDESPAVRSMIARLVAGESPQSHENDWILPDGSRHRLRWTNTVLTDADSSVEWVVSTGIDVTAERRATQLLNNVLDATTEQAVIATDTAGVITIYNTGAHRMLGFPPDRVLGTETPLLFHDPDELQERTRALEGSSGFDTLTALARSGQTQTQDWMYRRADGSRMPVTVSVSAMHRTDGLPSGGGLGGEVTGYLFVAVDATARKAREDELRSFVHEYAHRALHDELTGLANRGLLRDRLEHAIAVAARHDRYVGLLFLDLDGFKEINDQYGHVVGDELLHKVAERITNAARVSDTVARFGGDEFVVLCEDLHDPAELTAVASRVAAALSRSTVVGGEIVVPKASIGMVTVLGSEAEPNELISRADRAMYESRGVQLFDRADSATS